MKWNHVYSESFSVRSGVCQGGVLSPHLFAIYMDDLVVELRRLKVDCHIVVTWFCGLVCSCHYFMTNTISFIVNLFVTCLVYADDICLLAPCRLALQALLSTCENYSREWCLTHNPLKWKILMFGPHWFTPSFSM